MNGNSGLAKMWINVIPEPCGIQGFHDCTWCWKVHLGFLCVIENKKKGIRLLNLLGIFTQTSPLTLHKEVLHLCKNLFLQLLPWTLRALRKYLQALQPMNVCLNNQVAQEEQRAHHTHSQNPIKRWPFLSPPIIPPLWLSQYKYRTHCTLPSNCRPNNLTSFGGARSAFSPRPYSLCLKCTPLWDNDEDGRRICKQKNTKPCLKATA